MLIEQRFHESWFCNRLVAQQIHRSLYTAGIMRNAGCTQPHLHACEGPDQHQVVEIAKVADPEHLALKLSETGRSEEHTSELQSLRHLVCRLLLEKKNLRRPGAITSDVYSASRPT